MCIRDSLYIFVFDYIIFVRGIAFFLEACFTKDPNWDFYSLHTMLLIMVIFIVTLPFVLRFLTKEMRLPPTST